MIPDNYLPQKGQLTGRNLLVTGAASGLGRATALACAEFGATTILLDKNKAGLESLYDEIEAAGYPQAAIYPLDLGGANPDDYAQMAEVINENFDGLHGVVHAAADLGTLTPLDQYEEEVWYRVIQTNLNATFHLSKACLPLLRQQQQGRLMLFSCAPARSALAYWGAYAVAKAGIEAMHRVLGAELEGNASGCASLLVDPGPMRTQLRRVAYPAEDALKLKLPSAFAHQLIYLLDTAEITAQTSFYELQL